MHSPQWADVGRQTWYGILPANREVTVRTTRGPCSARVGSGLCRGWWRGRCCVYESWRCS